MEQHPSLPFCPNPKLQALPRPPEAGGPSAVRKGSLESKLEVGNPSAIRKGSLESKLNKISKPMIASENNCRLHIPFKKARMIFEIAAVRVQQAFRLGRQFYRLPKARLGSNGLVSSVHQEGTHSARQGPSDSSGSSPPNNGVSAGKRSYLPKRRGTRNSARGIDVVDDLMSSQGRSSKALLESLQSELALAKDPELKFQRDSTKDVSTGPFSARKFPEKNDVPQDQTETYGMVADRRSERPRPSDSLSGSALTSDIFSSAIENALSPLVSANVTHPNNTSSGNSDVVQHGAQVVSALQGASEARQPGLRGQEVLWALQKAAIEKAKRKQKVRKPNEKAVKVRENMPLHDASEWKNAKPIVWKPEWTLQIDDIERRIQSLKKPI